MSGPMKASELVAALTDIIGKVGDVDVVVATDSTYVREVEIGYPDAARTAPEDEPPDPIVALVWLGDYASDLEDEAERRREA